jgi:hypothetical protein
MTPATPNQVIASLIWKRWDPSIAFYNGSKACRRIGADLIRRTIAVLRKRRTLPDEVRVLVTATDLAADDDETERTWREAIDGLRVLFHASAIGTPREKGLLRELARNRRVEGDESLPSVANEVYVEKVGRDLPASKGETKEPVGRPWNFADRNEMRSRYPRLYRRFGK